MTIFCALDMLQKLYHDFYFIALNFSKIFKVNWKIKNNSKQKFKTENNL